MQRQPFMPQHEPKSSWAWRLLLGAMFGALTALAGWLLTFELTYAVPVAVLFGLLGTRIDYPSAWFGRGQDQR